MSVVVLENVNFVYGGMPVEALKDVCLSVPRGQVFALLGPSASGKTTLISAIIGLLTPTSGRIIFNYRTVGYMPQNYCLHEYFNVREIFYFYGRVYGISDAEARGAELTRVFDLDPDKVIKDCSGGMKRRVSLCCSLIHRPELIVLDEPTVGVDPALRVKIWSYLKNMSRSGSAVFVSTHYTEEAAYAEKFAFIRNGKILESGDVRDCVDMKKSYYDRCLQDENKIKLQENSVKTKKTYFFHLENSTHNIIQKTKSSSYTFSALCYKNLIVLKRHSAFMLFQVLLPLITLVIFMTAVGHSMRDLPVTIVNEENPHCLETSFSNFSCPNALSLLFQNFEIGSNLSCKILNSFPPDVLKIVHEESTVQNGRCHVENGESVALIYFPKDFTKNLEKRFAAMLMDPKSITTENMDLKQGSVSVTLDGTNKLVVDEIRKQIALAFETVLDEFLTHCEIPLDASIFRGITVVSDGNELEDLTVGMMPIMMTLTLYFMALALTADLTASEREAGILVRQTVAGIDFLLVIASQIIVQFIIVAAQIALTLIFTKLYVCLDCGVSLILLLGILFAFQSLSGMTIGILLSTICSTREEVIQYGMAIIFPTFLLCGLLWPLPSLHPILKFISVSLPVTLPGQTIQKLIHDQAINSVTNILLAGVIPLLWTAISSSLAIFVSKRFPSFYRA